MARIVLFVLLGGLVILPPARAQVGPATCSHFYQALEALPHESIFQQDGLYNSRNFATGAFGCVVVMVTSVDRLKGAQIPDFTREQAGFEGWSVNPKYSADGPGSGVVALEKGDALCLVYTDRPAFIDEAGQIVQSEHLSIRVECMEGE